MFLEFEYISFLIQPADRTVTPMSIEFINMIFSIDVIVFMILNIQLKTNLLKCKGR